ncbi:MAG: EamA family transporter [Ignavibacteriales bacterium]|nr:MAG: EamA family transporter [Ignavibacteriales bacterium]
MSGFSLKIFSTYAMLCLIWGSTWMAIRFGLKSLNPMFAAGMRFLLASAVIYLLMSFKKIILQKDKIAVRLYLLMGFFSFVIPFGLVYWGQQYVPSGLAAVLFAVYPFFVLLFSFFIIRSEAIGKNKIIGMILSFAGIITIFSDQIGGDLSSYVVGMIAIVLSGIMQASIAVMIKKYGQHLNPLSMNFVPMIIAGVVMLLVGLLFEDTSKLKFDLNAAGSVFYLAVFGSVITFTTYYWLLKRINIVVLSLIAFITPVVALILGWIIMGEYLESQQIIGSILVLLGLLIANAISFFKPKIS